MKKFAKMVTTVAALAAIATVSFAVGCSGETSSGYTLSGETLVQQTTGDSYYCGSLELAEDGSATLEYSTRGSAETENTVLYTWTGGTWTENENDTLSITLNQYPDGGGKGTYSGVETQLSLEDYELTATKNSRGKYELTISLDSNLITYSIHQYTEITLTQE